MTLNFPIRVVFGLVALLTASAFHPNQLAWGAPITKSTPTTEVTIYGGENNSTLQDFGGYFSYTDLILGEEVTWSVDPLLVFPDESVTVLSDGSAGGFGSPVDIGGGVVQSTATAMSADGTIEIDVIANTQLVGTAAQTAFSFASETSMAGTTFVFYTENDLFGFADDVAAFTGSIPGSDLQLFMFDSLAVSGGAPGLTVVLSGEGGLGADLSLFGADIWPAWGNSIESGDLSVLSADGSNFEFGPADLGLALGFDLTGDPGSDFMASVTVTYSTQEELPSIPIPEPTTLALLGLGLAGLGFRRRKS